MIRMHKFTFAVALVSCLAAFGCSSSSNGGSSGGSTACIASTGTTQVCTATSGLTAAQKKSSNNVCTKVGGTAVDSCPTDNQIGCCQNAKQQYKPTSCYYKASTDAGTTGGDAGANGYEQGCTQSGGTWTTP